MGIFASFVEHLSGVDGDVALRVRGDVVVPQIEQAFQIAFLHVHAEEVGVAFSQGESWLGFDAAEFVAWFQNEVVEAVDEVGVVFQFAQHGDDD